jgi:tripeptide aminopeptidase
MAHCDTVPLCVGTIPVRDGRFIQSVNPESGLGADNRTGVAVLLNLAFELANLNGRHPPVTLFWTVQEEVGMLGVRHVRVEHLRRPKVAFNIDGGKANKLTIGATGCYRMTMEFHGRAAHAALHPEEGINAITAAAVGIQALHAAGLIGKVGTGDQSVTTNVGTINGGTAVNVVPNRVLVQAEVRGHDPHARRLVLDTLCKTVRDAVATVCDRNGNPASVCIAPRLDYEAFRLDPSESCILAAERAIRSTGKNAIQAVTSGGIDSNWMYAHGIPVVSFGAGQVNGHTLSEKVDLDEFEAARRVALHLATDEEPIERSMVAGRSMESKV